MTLFPIGGKGEGVLELKTSSSWEYNRLSVMIMVYKIHIGLGCSFSWQCGYFMGILYILKHGICTLLYNMGAHT